MIGVNNGVSNKIYNKGYPVRSKWSINKIYILSILYCLLYCLVISRQNFNFCMNGATHQNLVWENLLQRTPSHKNQIFNNANGIIGTHLLRN